MSFVESFKAVNKMLAYIHENFPSEQSWAALASMGLGYTLDELTSTTPKQMYSNPRYNEANTKWLDNYIRDLKYETC